MTFLNSNVLSTLSALTFKQKWPYPWQEIQGFLTEEGFAELHKDFPSLELFEYHEGLARGYGQRPHNRYYLAYEKSYYKAQKGNPGVISEIDLEASWNTFIQELQENPLYRAFMQEVLGLEDWTVRFAWHRGQKGNEVSPHVDNFDKIATHIFYFNTDNDWNASWGGDILVLGDKLNPEKNPEFEDFGSAFPVPILNNRSFLFKNTPQAWHGVKALACPENRYRNLFNVIYGKK